MSASSHRKIIVLCNKHLEASFRDITAAATCSVSLVGIDHGPSLHAALRHANAKYYRREADCILNLCCGSDTEATGVSAATAASFLSHLDIPFSGCAATTLCYPLDVLFMMISYADIVLPRFQVVGSGEDVDEISSKVVAPIRIQAAAPCLGADATMVTEQSEVKQAVEQHFLSHGKLLVSEAHAGSHKRSVSVLATTGAHYTLEGGTLHDATLLLKCSDACAAFVKRVLYGKGYALLHFVEDEPDQMVLDHFVLNPDLTALPTKVPQLLELLASDALLPIQAPCFYIALHRDSRQGYHLCAARDIKKGDLVFEDEGRSFAMVTKPYVDKNWDADMKKTFSEYAWPLDSEGHLYAIWEQDPRRWRPINHSCDPNCIFDSPHSLNVIAARDIAKGDDLSMDYATFCDATMKPFECLCGSTSCRGMIYPSDGAIKQYGAHSWIRSKDWSELRDAAKY